MPQMSSLFWLWLMLLFIVAYSMFLMMIYFSITTNLKFNTKQNGMMFYLKF